jgi:lipopolysaccharide biosynthesis glycosyltransferase
MTAVAFFGDQNVVAPTHVALASTLSHWPGPDPLDIYVFQSGWSTADVKRLHRTVLPWADRCNLRVRELDLSRVARWKNMYGSSMPYGRLFLPELLPDCSTVLYLDVDVIVEMDLRVLVDASSQNGPVCAIQAWNLENSHDAALARERDLDLQAAYFHCRNEGIVERFVAFGNAYADRLWSHDQTVLNLVLHGQIAAIPETFTTHLYPAGPVVKPGRPAVHSFCGSPKPFDPLGNILNSNYAVFDQWLSRTALAGWSPNNLRQLLRVRKNLRLLRPMAGTALKMLQRRRHDAA